MIELTQGDILFADTEALVNTVNCVGVMGRGMVLQFRKAYPVNFKIYEAAFKRHEVPPRKDAGLRNGSPDRASIHRQFPDEASLEGQEPHRGYRRWTAGAC